MIEFPYCVYPALKRVFCERQYTRRQLADAVGISKSNVWWWLSGNNQHTIDVIKGIPRDLSRLTGLRETKFGAAPYDIKRAPQSWCYVEEVENA